MTFPHPKVKSRTSAFPTIEYFKDEGIKAGPDELQEITSDGRFVEEAKIEAT